MRPSSARLRLPTLRQFQHSWSCYEWANFGWNLGPFLYTLSGSIGPTYTAVERGIPGITFSAGYGVHTPYCYVNSTTNAALKDPATIAGELAANGLNNSSPTEREVASFPSVTESASTFPTSPLSQTPVSTHLSSKPE
jgi:hypothetical protein